MRRNPQASAISSLRVPEKLVYDVVAAWEESFRRVQAWRRKKGDTELDDPFRLLTVKLSIRPEDVPKRWPWPSEYVQLTLRVSANQYLPSKKDAKSLGLFYPYTAPFTGDIGLLWMKTGETREDTVETARHELGHALQNIARAAGKVGGFQKKSTRPALPGRYRKQPSRESKSSRPEHSLRAQEFKTNLSTDAFRVIRSIKETLAEDARTVGETNLQAQKEILRERVASEVSDLAERRFGSLSKKRAQKHASELYTLVIRGLAEDGLRTNPQESPFGTDRQGQRLTFDAASRKLSEAIQTVSQLREMFLLSVAQRDNVRKQLRKVKELRSEEMSKATAKAESDIIEARRKSREACDARVRHKQNEMSDYWRSAIKEVSDLATQRNLNLRAQEEELQQLRSALKSATERVEAGGLDPKKLRRQREADMRKQSKRSRRKGR